MLYGDIVSALYGLYGGDHPNLGGVAYNHFAAHVRRQVAEVRIHVKLQKGGHCASKLCTNVDIVSTRLSEHLSEPLPERIDDEEKHEIKKGLGGSVTA